MKKARPIMIQGTMSSAGKSLVCTALCRIFAQDGYRVAPFKSQNMALNSFITEEGLEMGRAQVAQAEAAGAVPSVLMNPILLKPTTDFGSQVIVMGEVRGNMRASEYFRYKKELIPDILRAYHALEQTYDIIVIEGAGSPAEINLKQTDIVNMGMAQMADSPVLLVGDIDRGGVFAQLYGTVSLLAPEERARIKATIINKFRGDASILASGLDMLYELVGVPCAGIVPYVDADIDDEDSLSRRLENRERKEIDIAVIRLPRISNFTDFAPFEQYENVSLRYVSSIKELGTPDLVILPGTKSTISDLKWLRESGLEAAVLKLASHGTPVFGICGGFQMLGRTISDPCGAEGGGVAAGMGLLEMDTVFHGEKTRLQISGSLGAVTGIFSGLSGMDFTGYEIHMGNSTERDTLVCRGHVYGSYVHGLFDAQGIADEMVRALCARRGLAFDGDRPFDRAAYKEEQYNKLAHAVREALDMKLIYDILEKRV